MRKIVADFFVKGFFFFCPSQFSCVELISAHTGWTDCLCYTAGEHVDIHQSGGASGHIGICHRSGKRFLYGWDRCILSDHWIHFRHQQQVKVLCRVRLSGTHSLICGLLSRVVKIPLWRWQWMMIYMLINAIGCIISSVLLNIVDHRQARQHTHTHFVLCLMHWQQPHFWYFSFPRAGSWTRWRKTGSRKTMTVSHWATNRTQKNHQSDLLSSEVWMVLFFFISYFLSSLLISEFHQMFLIISLF